MTITQETRQVAFYESRDDSKSRKKLIYQALKTNGPMTVDELIAHLIRAGKLKSYDRNYVAPRLTELKEDGLVETVGKRKSPRTKKPIAVWQTTEVDT